MIEVTPDPGDLRELQKTLTALVPANLLRGELGPLAEFIGERVGKYPPVPANSTYRRTGTLGRSWYYKLINPLAAEVGNLAKYAGWVHGPRQVAKHRSTGWIRLFDLGQKMFNAFIKRIGYKVDRIWK